MKVLYDGGDATRDDFDHPFTTGHIWLVTRDGEGDDYSWVVLGSEKDAWATVHHYLQDQGCQVCMSSERNHADGSIDPFPHPFETNDTDDEIDTWWTVEGVEVYQRK